MSILFYYDAEDNTCKTKINIGIKDEGLSAMIDTGASYSTIGYMQYAKLIGKNSNYVVNKYKDLVHKDTIATACGNPKYADEFIDFIYIDGNKCYNLHIHILFTKNDVVVLGQDFLQSFKTIKYVQAIPVKDNHGIKNMNIVLDDFNNDNYRRYDAVARANANRNLTSLTDAEVEDLCKKRMHLLQSKSAIDELSNLLDKR